MHISHIMIRNFRGLEDIDFSLTKHVNVIVGPNAIGKTTILQAVRLVKSIVSPRVANETQQVLISLGAASPHFPQNIFLHSLSRNPQLETEIRCTIEIGDTEISKLESGMSDIIRRNAAARVGQSFQNPALLLQFFQSPQGQEILQQTSTDLSKAISEIKRDGSLVLGVKFNPIKNEIFVVDATKGFLISYLDQILPPSLSIFSFFPADRALPMGEVGLQLGGSDAQQQLETHNSQPQLKYARLKNLIINALVLEQGNQNSVKQEFEKIFSGILRGRRIASIAVNEFGLLSVMTEEIATGRMIELDSLSSGEKNVALTFLLVATSVADGGIVLFDEPELHLNASVSLELLSFMIENYAKPRKIQFLMCTHSPEVLAGAFNNEECSLLHLKSSTDITRVGKKSLAEYSDALQKLGASVTEGLFHEGTILVEGVGDVTMLEIGFPDLIKKYKIKDRGGRKEVEKTVKELQELEKKGEKVAPIFLVFDRDDEPTTLENSAAVRIMQWDRRCIENYLLDSATISILLSDPTVTRTPISSAGDVQRFMKKLAKNQLDETAARIVYTRYAYINSSLMKTDAAANSLTDLAKSFYDRMNSARKSLSSQSEQEWQSKFISDAKIEYANLEILWDAKWEKLCDGKRLISDLHKGSDLKMSEAAFKIKIMNKMREDESDSWKEANTLLKNLLDKSTL